MTAKTATPTGELTFTDAEVPATTTSAKPNPFAPKVQSLTSVWDDENGRSTSAASVNVPTSDKGKYLRMIESAGKSVGKSVRKTTTETGDATTITFWVVDKITRKPSPAAAGTADVPLP